MCIVGYWLCSLGVILYNTATPYPKTTRIPQPRTLANDLSIVISIANFLSIQYIIECSCIFANFFSTLYSILARHVSLFSLHVQENVTYILKYTKSLSLSCADVYSRMFKHGF